MVRIINPIFINNLVTRDILSNFFLMIGKLNIDNIKMNIPVTTDLSYKTTHENKNKTIGIIQE